MSRRTSTTSTLTTLAVGAVAAAIGYEVAAEHFLGAATATIVSSAARTASDISVDLKALQAIRANDAQAAAHILEAKLNVDRQRILQTATPPSLFPWNEP
jgi:hypothetical protein